MKTDLTLLIENGKGLFSKIIVLGNSPAINKLDWEKVDELFSIGVNRIGYAYNPTILLWNVVFYNKPAKLVKKYKEVIDKTKSIKVCRNYEFTWNTPAEYTYNRVNEFSHEWNGGLVWDTAIFSALHLAMLLTPKTIYIAGVDYLKDQYFWEDRARGKPYGATVPTFNEDTFKLILNRFREFKEACECEVLFCSKGRIPGFKVTGELNAK